MWGDALRGKAGAHADLPGILGLVAVCCLLYPDALRGWVFANGDLQIMFLGQLDAIVQCVSRGSLPLWDPTLGFGQPLLANPGHQVLYPATWLNLLLLPETYLTLYVLGHTLWAGLGLAALARRALGLSGWAAWLAGAGWMASGPLVSHVQRWQHFASVSWLPWVVLSAHAAVLRPTATRLLALSTTLALQWLSGSVEIAALSGLAALAWTAGLTLRSPEALRRLVRVWALAGTTAVALTCALWLPALDLLRHSARDAVSASTQMAWAVHPSRLLELFTPMRTDQIPLRRELREVLFGRTGTTIVPSLYLGAAMTGLVLLGLWRSPRRRLTVGLALFGCGAGLFAMGPHVSGLSWLMAQFSLVRFPGKLALPLSFAWALLGALGLDSLSRQPPRRSPVRGLALPFLAAAMPPLGVVLLGVGLPGFLARYVLTPVSPGTPVWDAVGPEILSGAGAASLTCAAGGLAWLGARQRAWRGASLAGVAILAAGDLLVPNHRVNELVPSALLGYPETAERLREAGASRIHVVEDPPQRGVPPTTGGALADPALGLPPAQVRALTSNLALEGRSATRWGFSSSFTIGPVIAPTREQYALAQLLRSMVGQPGLRRLLQVGGVSHLVAREAELTGLIPVGSVTTPLPPAIFIFQIPDPLPRAFFVGAAETVTDRRAFESLQQEGVDLRRAVLLADGPAEKGTPDSTGTVQVATRRPDRIEVEVAASGRGYLVLLDAYAPGWRASVDGRTAPVRRANYGFRAVAVPPGRHLVSIWYRPAPVAAGALVSLATLLAIALVAARTLARRRQA